MKIPTNNPLNVYGLVQLQWESGFEPHRCHCVVSLSKTQLSLLSTGLTQEDCPDVTERFLIGK